MLFNSISFVIFFPIVYLLYWKAFGKNYKQQNILLLVASYYFYSCWDWRFLFLLIFSTLLDYFSGLMMESESKKNKRKFWFWLSVVINLGFLGVFKYYNFFSESFAEMLDNIGIKVNASALNIILPVGISFYTFHGLSYVIDIYNKKINAEKNFVEYALFVSFFPLLVAGPIERATHLLPQIKTTRKFNKNSSVDGLKQILWGFFKKIVIADQCAIYANEIFNNYITHTPSTLALGAVLFAIQIYGDFSGYSDIALGSARLLGIELLKNFSFPYFSRDISEFWRRWHISLSSWFRDYLYFPLGGSRGTLLKTIRNTFIIFIVSGFWHGANWTFIVWGGLNALYIIPLVIYQKNRTNLDVVASGKQLPSIKDMFSILLTFSLTVLAWIFFRSATVTDAYQYIVKMISPELISVPSILPKKTLLFCFLFFAVEWMGRESNFAIANIFNKWPKFFRHALYYILICCIIYFSGQEQQFIYFQF
jgi:alginate O-acetyltransferase complex protein AlgI